jgi:prolyl oligopeptidase
MNRFIARKLMLGLASYGFAATSLAGPRAGYPAARQESIAERHFGLTYYDSFRWMENQDDPELIAWTHAQNRFALAQLGTAVDTLAPEFEALLAPSPLKSKGVEFGDERVNLRDRFRPDASSAVFDGSPESPSGKLKVEHVADAKSDYGMLRILDDTGAAKPDVLFAKFSQVFWTSEDAFLYLSDRDSRLGGATSVIRSHRLGTTQAEDRLVFEAKKAIHSLALYKVDGRFVLMEWVDDKTSLSFLDVDTGALTPILAPAEGTLLPFEARGTKLYALDFRSAPLGEVVTIDVNAARLETLVPAHAHALDQAALAGDQLYVSYLHDVESRLYRFDGAKTGLVPIDLPGAGSVMLKAEEGELGVAFSSYTEKATIWVLNKETGALVLKSGTREPPFPLEASKTFYTAHDGRQVPIWIIRKLGTALTPSTPMYLYGYGGFSVNILPALSRDTLPWLQRGGVVAMATLPGGLEYGEDWHRAGWRGNKRKVFDDFAAAARHLIAQGYTNPDKIAISGASNGGLLVGATINLYPDLFRVAVPEVGVMDLTKFQLFTGGKWWVDEYGDRMDREAFFNQYSLSPYHQLRPRRYPATLVMTADADDRVVPTHSYKYAARLQQVQDPSRLALLWTRRGGSHGWSTGTVKEAARARAVKWAFIMQELGVQP